MIEMSMKLQSAESPLLKRIYAQLNKLNGQEVSTGLQGKSAQQKNAKNPDSDLTVVQYAAVNEFGGTHSGGRKGAPVKIPERSFVRSTYFAHEKKYAKLSELAMKKALKGEDPMMHLKVLAKACEHDMRETVRAGGVPYRDNSAWTQKEKGRNEPLIWTGLLLASIHSVTEKKRAK